MAHPDGWLEWAGRLRWEEEEEEEDKENERRMRNRIRKWL